MTDRDLKRRISDALLAGGLDQVPDLAAALAEDETAAEYAKDAEKLDALLHGWPLPDRGDEAWETLAARIDQRLKDPVRSPGDLTLAPRFDEDDPFVREPRAAAAPARPGGAAYKPLTSGPRPASPAKPVVAPKPFTVGKPGAAPAKPAPAPHAKPPDAHAKPLAHAPAHDAKPATPTPAAHEASPPSAEPAVALAPPPPGGEPAALAPPPPGAEPPAPSAEGAEVDAPVTFSEPPIAISEPPMAISEPPDSLSGEAPASAEFSLSNLSKLDVHHAPPPVPAAALAKHGPAARAPSPKNERASIPLARQPIAPIAPLPSFESPVTSLQQKKKASRAPLYGMLALAATLVLAFGGWMTLQRGAEQSPAPDAVAAVGNAAEAPDRDQAARPEQQGAGAMPMEEPHATPTMPMMPGMPALAPSPTVADGTPSTADDNGAAVGAARPTAPPPPPVALALRGGEPAMQQPADTEAEGAARHAHHAGHAGGGGGGVAPSGPVHVAPATGGGGHATHAPAGGAGTTGSGGSGGGDAPARTEIVRAMGTVHDAVVSCAQGRGGVAWVQVTFAGPTGRVSSAVVQGNFAGTPQGSCIARAVRGAQVSSFRSATFSVAYPFQL